MTTLAVPIQASQDIRFRVRILASSRARIAATAVKTALHVPWVETALRAIEVLIIPDPATKIQPVKGQQMASKTLM
jgi:hypothetical protein